MRKIIVMTDIHANVLALRAAVIAISREGYDFLYHTGDAVAIGPFPEETLSLLFRLGSTNFVMGNHDAWLVHGLPDPQPPWMSDGEVAHHKWLSARVLPAVKEKMRGWPYLIEEEIEGVRLAFVHYGLARNGRDYLPILPEPSIQELDEMFEQHHAQLVFYGHHHPFSDREGRARYINPGSLGCYSEAVARYAVVYLHNGTYEVEHHAVPYDDRQLLVEFERRNVPERELIWRVFFGGRSPT